LRVLGAPLYGGLRRDYAAGGSSGFELSLTAFGMIYLAYPLRRRLAMSVRFVAIGIYEVSRRRGGRAQKASVRGIWSTLRARGRTGGWPLSLVRVCDLDVEGALMIAMLIGSMPRSESLQEFITVVLHHQ